MAMNNVQLEPEVLRGILSGLANAPSDYIADAAVPMTPTKFGRGSIPILSSGSHFGLAGQNGARLPGGEVSVGPGAGFDAVDYQIELYDRAERVPYELANRSQLPIPVLRMYLGQAVDFLRVGREQRLATVITGTTWALNTPLAGADCWDTATSDPVLNISTAVEAIRGSVNTIIMGRSTWNALRTNQTVLSALSLTQDHALMSNGTFANAVASHFNVPANRIFVGRASRLTTNNPDDASDITKLTDIFGDFFWIGQVGGAGVQMSDSNPDLLFEPTALARVQESDLADNYMQFQRDEYKSWQVQTGVGEHLLAVTAGLGAIITNTVT